MNKQDWYDVGSQLGEIVQSAIDQGDFEHLNQSLSRTINDTFARMQMNSGQVMGRSRDYTKRKEAASDGIYHPRSENAFEEAGRSASFRGGLYQERMKQKFRPAPAPHIKGESRTTAKMILGYVFAGLFGVQAVTFLLVGFVHSSIMIPGILLAGATGWCISSIMKAKKKRKRIQLTQRILQILGERDSCTIEELVAGTGMGYSELVDEIRIMIREGMFPQAAYLDAGATCIMTSHQAYQQYRETERAYQVRKEQEQRAQMQQDGRLKKYESYPKEVQKILLEGEDFISHIRSCNDAIPDPEMTDKLSRLEGVVSRIFAQVEKKPEMASDLHKLMSYYLPITRKLVDAYYNLEQQQSNGNTITKTKREINESLDTINTAFENLLDSFFQETEWDVASDISVLHTMMAQDGLTNRDFAAGAGAGAAAVMEKE